MTATAIAVRARAVTRPILAERVKPYPGRLLFSGWPAAVVAVVARGVIGRNRRARPGRLVIE